MILLAWNCRGLTNLWAVHFLKETINRFRPSIVFLSKTLVKKNKIAQLCKQGGFSIHYVVDVQGHSGGLALLRKNEGGVQIINSCNNFIDFEVVNDQVARWRYTGVYGYPERGRRQEAWNMLRCLAERSSLPWCIIGDFNDLMTANEKRGWRNHPRSLLQEFSSTVFDCDLKDLGSQEEFFTWEKYRGTNKWEHERPDRGLANQAWIDMFPEAVVKVVESSTSNHLPLVLDLNKRVYAPRSRRFHFENMWVREKDCYSLINNCWHEEGHRDIMDKVAFCCIKLEEWGGRLVKEMKNKLTSLVIQMRRLRSR